MIQTALPSVPAEVQAFADEQGVAATLSSILALTQRIFPQAARIETVVELDPGIEDERYIVIDVYLPVLKPAEYPAANRQWSEGVCAFCSGPQVGLFRLIPHEGT